MKQQQRRASGGRILGLSAASIAIICLFCALGGVFLYQVARPESSTITEPSTDPAQAKLTLAYSPEKATLLQPLVEDFNRSRQRTPDGRVMQVELVEMPPDQMVEAALTDAPGFQALSPDASFWLDQLDLRWADLRRDEQSDVAPRRVADSARYAISPIVIAAWPEVAEALGWGSRPVSWSDIQQKAASDRNFRWSHASTSYASGMLATLAEFYAGAGKTRGLTEEDVTAKRTLDYVRDIERTISFYGENEAAAIQRMRQEGRKFLDALVVQEALVVQHNREGKDDLVAIYPHEGTLWEDHPLALLDDPSVTDNQRRTFLALRDFLLAPDQQQRILAAGFRPADLNVPIDGANSPISPANGLDPKEPQTTLQVPGPSVMQVVQNAWRYTKRPSNIYLVVDTSGSMYGDKIDNVKLALETFVNQIQGTQDRLGMALFSSSVYNIIPPEPVDAAYRQSLQSEIKELTADGDTALLDAVRAAYVRLQQQADAEAINAIVVMTDGLENASSVTLQELTRQIERENSSGVPIIIFAVAYGDDADYDTLRVLADASDGQVREGNIDTIRELYRLLSQYF